MKIIDCSKGEFREIAAEMMVRVKKFREFPKSDLKHLRLTEQYSRTGLTDEQCETALVEWMNTGVKIIDQAVTQELYRVSKTPTMWASEFDDGLEQLAIGYEISVDGQVDSNEVRYEKAVYRQEGKWCLYGTSQRDLIKWLESPVPLFRDPRKTAYFLENFLPELGFGRADERKFLRGFNRGLDQPQVQKLNMLIYAVSCGGLEKYFPNGYIETDLISEIKQLLEQLTIEFKISEKSRKRFGDNIDEWDNRKYSNFLRIE